MKTPDLPEEKPSAPDKADYNQLRSPAGVGQEQNHADAERALILIGIANHNPGNGIRTQRSRIMAALHRLNCVTTIECSRFLDIIHPPRRVMELREAGEAIATHWRREPTECGKLHRVGLYVLESQKPPEQSRDAILTDGAALPERILQSGVLA